MKVAVDASAILAVLPRELDSEIYLSKLLSATKLWISPINWWEVQVLMHSRQGSEGERIHESFLNVG